jgi:CHAT domain
MEDHAPAYDDLSIRIQRAEGGHYHAVVTAADGATASGAFQLPFTQTEVDNFVLKVGRQRLPVRGYRSAQMEVAKEFGSRLFESLIAGAVRDLYRSARAVAEKSRKGLRVTLCLTDAPELMDVPWEFLYERPSFLAQSIYSPIVRSLDLTEVRTPRQIDLPLNVLGLVSSPRGFDNLDVEREQEKLTQALAPLSELGLVTIEWLPAGTLGALDEAIARRQETHVFHFIGHGAYDSRSGGGFLILENERGDPHEVSGEELGLLLQDERSLRLGVLNSCEGARSSHLDPFSGVASSLVQHGIPAVIGMQFEITDKAATTFAGRFYASLAQGLPVDAAMAQSRRSIFAAGNDIEFGTPVLFLRGAEARLFEVIDPPAPDAGVESPGAVEPVDDPIEPAQAPSAVWEEPSRDPIPAWLPKPWQDWLREGVVASLRRRLRHTSNRRLALLFGFIFILGILIAAIFGHEDSSGNRQNTWGTILMLIGFFGLWWAVVRAVYDRLRVRYDRLRNWWTGNG